MLVKLIKKTHGPLLLKLAVDARCLPVIRLTPVMPAIETPRMLIKPPTGITFETIKSKDLEDEFDLQWLEVATETIKSITNLKDLHMLDVYMNDIVAAKNTQN